MYGRKREQKAKRDIQGVDTITVSALHCYPSQYNIAAMNAAQFLLRLNTLRLVKADWYIRESNEIMQRNAKTSQTTASTISTVLNQHIFDAVSGKTNHATLWFIAGLLC